MAIENTHPGALHLSSIKNRRVHARACSAIPISTAATPAVRSPAELIRAATGQRDVDARLPLDQAALGYELFENKQEDCRKVVLIPTVA